MDEATSPKSIEVSNKEQVLEITWQDDHKSTYSLFGLRKNCPCVMCRGGHANMSEFEPEAFFEENPSRIEIRDLRQVGNHALQINWGDGHNSGMYQWGTLRWLDPENHKKES